VGKRTARDETESSRSLRGLVYGAAMPAERSARRCDIDWLRIGATLLLFPFHAARPFDHQPWHVKSAAMSEGFDVWVWLVHQFHMPLFFLLAGWSLERSLVSRDLRDVRRERVARLLVPFLFGVALLSPPQAYVEGITQRGLTGGYLAFLPHFFTSLRWFSWHHLWFLIYLFTFSMLYMRPLSSLPAFRDVTARHVWLAIVPLTLVQAALRWRWPGYQNLYDDWANFCWYSALFAAGFVIARSPDVETVIRAERRRATVVFVAAILAMLPLLATLRDRVAEPGPAYLVYWALSTTAGVSALVALLGHARRWERAAGTAFAYLREAALPLYVLHQAVIVVLGYWLVTADAPIGLLYLTLLATSFGATLAIYHLIVRRSRALRVAFGMREAAARPHPAATLRAAG
jgi:fucose 4-O-acetylase-like acetyltransferase